MEFITGDNLQSLLGSDEPKICLYVMSDHQEHSLNNALALMYIKTPTGKYYTSFTHPDESYQPYDGLILRNAFVFDIKKLMNLGLVIQDCFDLRYFMDHPEDDILFNFYKHRLNGVRELNLVIPLYSHLQRFELFGDYIFDWMKEHRGFYEKQFTDKYLKFYHSLVPFVFSSVERQGVPVSVPMFVGSFGPDKEYLVRENLIHTEYNCYTTTGRPSNAHGGINYAALNKSDHSRESFVSRYDDGILVNIDFNSYHLFLIAEKTGIILPDDPHTILGKYYFDTEELTDEQYEESKVKTFRNLYGHQDDTVKDIPFFKKVRELEDSLWKEYTSLGYVTTEFGKLLKGKDLTKNKLFNYYIQALETEMNVKQMYSLIKEGHIPILYTYDSMVFDIHRDYLEEFTYHISNILKYPFSIEFGSNLKF